MVTKIEKKKEVKEFVRGNSLAAASPELAAQWNYEKNGSLTPADVANKHLVAVWWKCEKGHEWKSSPYHRARNAECPYCKKEQAMAETNLSITHPEIAKDWHPTKNRGLNPSDVKSTSLERVFWLCENGHEIDETVSNRTKRGGCMQCEKQRKAIENSIEKFFPEVAAEWHPTKNGDVKPSEISYNSPEKYWWICPEGHEYERAVYSRTHGGGCPICSNKLVASGINDLATTHPEIAAEWHPTMNGDAKPTQVTAGSSKEQFWLKGGEVWKETIFSRTGKYDRLMRKRGKQQ